MMELYPTIFMVGGHTNVDQFPHFGHIINSSLNDDVDIIFRQGRFIGQVNHLFMLFQTVRLTHKKPTHPSLFAVTHMAVSFGIFITLLLMTFVLLGDKVCIEFGACLETPVTIIFGFKQLADI
jgi:hypothetical protein